MAERRRTLTVLFDDDSEIPGAAVMDALNRVLEERWRRLHPEGDVINWRWEQLPEDIS